MIKLAGLFAFTLVNICFAQIPDPVITTMTSYNGYATIAGRLNSRTEVPVGISVRNGNLIYATTTDPEGRWAVVIRHLAVNVTVQSWSFGNPTERSQELKQDIQLESQSSSLRGQLPWTRYVSASGSSSSETSAKYSTETDLRWKIDSLRSNCRFDKGSFSYSGGYVYCYKSGMTYNCSANATCSCR